MARIERFAVDDVMPVTDGVPQVGFAVAADATVAGTVNDAIMMISESPETPILVIRFRSESLRMLVLPAISYLGPSHDDRCRTRVHVRGDEV